MPAHDRAGRQGEDCAALLAFESLARHGVQSAVGPEGGRTRRSLDIEAAQETTCRAWATPRIRDSQGHVGCPSRADLQLPDDCAFFAPSASVRRTEERDGSVRSSRSYVAEKHAGIGAWRRRRVPTGRPALYHGAQLLAGRHALHLSMLIAPGEPLQRGRCNHGCA